MKEALFIYQNVEKWKSYEDELNHIAQQTPDRLADIYIDVTNDLSFVRTNYPYSKIEAYLNGLSSQIHQFMHEKRKMKFSRILDFWKYDLPKSMYECRRELLISFIVFAVAVFVGAFSSANDEGYVRLILGNRYVDMTLENIANDDPMAVYKDEYKSDMFWAIALNNVRVSLITFMYGLFTSIGPAYILLRNGVMVGSFQYFFLEYGLFWDSFLTIWLHGTLEMSELVLAGCAGIVMGNGWLFPGSYSRIESFKRSARRGIKIIIGGIPITLLAAVIESYLTRYTDISAVIRSLIILFSLAFIIFYYIYYPRKLSKANTL